jgi:hypothetical protein
MVRDSKPAQPKMRHLQPTFSISHELEAFSLSSLFMSISSIGCPPESSSTATSQPQSTHENKRYRVPYTSVTKSLPLRGLCWQRIVED